MSRRDLVSLAYDPHHSLFRSLHEDGTTEEGEGGGQAQRRNRQELRDLLGGGHVRCGCGDHGEDN